MLKMNTSGVQMSLQNCAKKTHWSQFEGIENKKETEIDLGNDEEKTLVDQTICHVDRGGLEKGELSKCFDYLLKK